MKLSKRSSALPVVLVLMLVSASLVAAQSSPEVYVEPPSQTVGQGDQSTVSIMVNNAVYLYGAQLQVTFVNTGVATPVSVAPGWGFTQYPNEYDVAQADVSGGTVDFAATLLRVPKANPLCGNVELAVITFDAVGQGTTKIALTEVRLSDDNGDPISFDTTDGTVEVGIVAANLEGNAFMESRTDHSGILISLFNSPILPAPFASPLMTTTTDLSGAYAFSGVPAGPVTVTMSSNLYLDAMATGVTVVANQSNYVCDVTMLGGDLNGDGIIDILDLSLCAAHFGSAGPPADVNADGWVDVYDLVLLGKNFKLTAPTTVNCTP
jgi:hypothetical protein